MERYLDAVWTLIERSDDTALFLLMCAGGLAVLLIALAFGIGIFWNQHMNEKDDDAFDAHFAEIADANVEQHKLAEAA